MPRYQVVEPIQYERKRYERGEIVELPLEAAELAPVIPAPVEAPAERAEAEAESGPVEAKPGKRKAK